MTFLLQFNSLRKRLNLQRKRRLHASPHTLSYEDTASNQRDKSLIFRTGGVARGAQTDFFVVSVSFQGLNQPLNLVKLDKTDIVTHVQTPSINSGLRTTPGEPVIWPAMCFEPQKPSDCPRLSRSVVALSVRMKVAQPSSCIP